MRLYEIEIKERYPDDIVSGEEFFMNPTQRDLFKVIKSSEHGAARFGFDRDGNLWVWSADGSTHHDVHRSRIGLDEPVGFSTMLIGGEFRVWADTDSIQKRWPSWRTHPKIMRMFGGRVEYDEEANRQYWHAI